MRKLSLKLLSDDPFGNSRFGNNKCIPDATKVAFFRKRLRKANVIEEHSDMFASYLRDQGK